MKLPYEEIVKIIRESIFHVTGKHVEDIHQGLTETNLLTSITMAELAVELERKLDVSFNFMEINKENFASVSQIIQLIAKKTG